MNLNPLYIKLCKSAGKSERLKDLQDPPDELEQNLELLNTEINGKEVIALAYLSGIIGTIATGITALIAWIFDFSFLIPSITGFMSLLTYLVIGWYPSWKVKSKRSDELGNLPRMINYMTILLKINPNLEKSLKFTAENLDRSLGNDLKNELWKLCTGEYSNAKEAISKFEKRLNKYKEDLNHSIFLIKSSVDEKSEASRKNLLDQALESSFLEVRETMESFAEKIKLPTIVIYGIGVLMPLVLIAVIPVLSSTGANINGTHIALIYCLIIPSVIFVIKKQILENRPETFPSPDIPSRDDVKKALAVALAVIILPCSAGLVLKIPTSLLVIVSLWSISIGIAIFCYLNSKKTYEIRRKNLKLEKEFCDALVQLGNQLKSNRPPEEAFRRTSKTSKGSEISEILEKTAVNMKTGGMDTRSAFFDEEFGSLKNVYTTPIRNTFRIMVDLLNRGSKAAGEAILHSAKHLKQLKKIEKQTQRTLSEIVNSMKSVSLFFAPFVASFTVQIQRTISERTFGMPFFGSGIQIPNTTFLGVLGLYTIVITVLLSTYTTEIEKGDDRLTKLMEIAHNLPISMTVFTFGLFIGRQSLGLLMG